MRFAVVAPGEESAEFKLRLSARNLSDDELRLRVFKRDNYTCVLCGRCPSVDIGTVLHVDHIVPFSKGGPHDLGNLRTLCARCNLARGNDQNV